MASSGFLQVRAYSSNAVIPLKNVAITVTELDGTPIALRLTNRSGQLDTPIEIPVPDLSESLAPNPGIKPYTTVNVYARLEDYELIEVERVQLFADTVTLQDFEMIPLSEFPENRNKVEIFDTIPQSL